MFKWNRNKFNYTRRIYKIFTIKIHKKKVRMPKKRAKIIKEKIKNKGKTIIKTKIEIKK